MKNKIGIIFLGLFLASCSAHAIIPAKLTYTYPPAEPMAYDTDVAFGAIAFIDERIFDLYLPYFDQNLRSKPKRFVFTPTDPSNVRWLGRPARGKETADITARFVLESEDLKNQNGAQMAALTKGALVVTFPQNESYKGLSGQTIWLIPSVGWNEVYHVRGVYLKSRSKLPESVGFQFSSEDISP